MTAAGSSSRHRVLRAITRLNVGGPARHATTLTRELDAEFPTLLVAGRLARGERAFDVGRIPVVELPLTRQLRPHLDARAFVTMRRLLKKEEPAIVHSHLSKAGVIARSAVLADRSSARTVHTFHGHVLDGYFSSAATRIFLEIERALAARTDVLIAVSGEIRDELLDLGVGSRSRFEVIELGLDLEPFLSIGAAGRGAMRERMGIPPDAPLAVTVGRLVPVKDHRTLLQAVAAVPGLHLLVAGGGELRVDLEGHVERLALTERVHFAGWVQDVAALLSEADLVVSSSLNEGTPLALIEAHAAGLPIVATDVGGVGSVVVDGATGWIVPPADPVILADRLQALAASPEGTRQAMGARGRERVRHRFGARRLIEDMRALYRSLLEEPH